MFIVSEERLLLKWMLKRISLAVGSVPKWRIFKSFCDVMLSQHFSTLHHFSVSDDHEYIYIPVKSLGLLETIVALVQLIVAMRGFFSSFSPNVSRSLAMATVEEGSLLVTSCARVGPLVEPPCPSASLHVFLFSGNRIFPNRPEKFFSQKSKKWTYGKMI